MIQKIQISNLLFSFAYDGNLPVDEEIASFLYKGAFYAKEIKVFIRQVEDFEPLSGEIVHVVDQRAVIMKNAEGNLEYRIFLHPCTGTPYVLYKEHQNGEITMQILKDVVPEVCLNGELLEHIALEKYLLEDESIVLHSSSVIYQEEALLFSAPSGTGKSTQAQLWNRCRGCRILNGDRNILHRKSDGTWEVHGLPFSGTSGIQENECRKLRAVVRLGQAERDFAEKQNPLKAFKNLYSEITVNSWDVNYVEKALRLCRELTERADICHLSCTMNESAVQCLENYLERGSSV